MGPRFVLLLFVRCWKKYDSNQSTLHIPAQNRETNYRHSELKGLTAGITRLLFPKVQVNLSETSFWVNYFFYFFPLFWKIPPFCLVFCGNWTNRNQHLLGPTKTGTCRLWRQWCFVAHTHEVLDLAGRRLVKSTIHGEVGGENFWCSMERGRQQLEMKLECFKKVNFVERRTLPVWVKDAVRQCFWQFFPRGWCCQMATEEGPYLLPIDLRLFVDHRANTGPHQPNAPHVFRMFPLLLILTSLRYDLCSFLLIRSLL